MRLKLAVTLGTAVMLVAAAAACGGPPPPPPEPEVDSAAILDSIARAREDSIRRAREDSIRRAQAEAERLRREREAAMREETEAVRAMIAERVHFDFDRSNIRSGRDTEVLQQKLAILQANPNVQLEIVGHCDERGSDEYNLALGNRRAVAAKQWLVDRGIDAARVAVRSMGEEQPLNPASNEEAWAQNRRDEFTITAGGDQLVRPGM